MSEFMKRPCRRCPFRKDVTPYLTTERAEELAYNASSPHGCFSCHETTEYDDEVGESYNTEDTKECAGHLTLQHHETGETFYDEEGFEPSPLCYENTYEMIEAYEIENGDGQWEHVI